MGRERDDESGQYTSQYPREAFLNGISTADPATTQKVAEEVGCSYNLAYRRLQALEESKTVSNQEVGNSLLWSRTDN